MWKKLYDKLKELNIKVIGRMLFLLQVFILCFFSIWIFIDAPKNEYFDNMPKENIWYGDDWRYVNADGKPEEVNEHYLKLQKNEETVTITKVISETALEDKYLCFRVRAREINIYVNGRLWQQKIFPERTRVYASSVYIFYQYSVKDLQQGDRITIEFTSADRGNYIVQYLSLGNRYSIESYVVSKCGITLLICGCSLLLLMFTILIYYSSVMLGKIEGYKSLWWLASFLLLWLIYLLTDCGILDLLIRKSVLIYWMNTMSFMLMPIPLLIYIKRTFYPGAKRYDILISLNHVLIIGCLAEYVIRGFDLMRSSVYVYVIILVAVVMGLIGLVIGRKRADKEVLAGSAVICIATFIGLIVYLRGDSAVGSQFLGAALFLYSLCMLVFTISSRTKARKKKDEAMVKLLAREKEAAELASEQKTRFLSHMSHEIRTPLNAVLGMNELIMRESKEENVRSYSRNIQSAGKTLLGLINDVLDFSKIDTGKMEIVEAEYSLSSLINDVVCMERDRVQKKGLELRLDISSSIPDKLMGDEIRVKQIMINLLTNATKYTQKGWVLIKMHHVNVAKDMVEIIIEVSDSGIGIKEEELPKLFQDFERLDQLKNRSIEGSGLGLNITAGLVKMMHGEIEVESEYGKGSTFRVVLHQKVISDAPIGDYNSRIRQIEMQSSEEKKDIIALGGKRVLVVDDNDMNLEVIGSILEMMEMDVKRASSGAEALEILGNEGFDIVITDDMMPGMTGTELMITVKGNHDCPNVNTPMIVLTANAVSGVAEEYMKRGFQDYLTKPIDIEQLQKVLKKYLIE